MNFDTKNMNYTYQYRIYPNKDQKILLNKHFGCTRWIYNHFLAFQRDHYEMYKDTKRNKYVGYVEMANALPKLKEEYEWLKEINSQSLQQSLKDLDQGYKRFFEMIGNKPVFKSKNNSKNSFRVPQYFKVSAKGQKLWLPKFDTPIKMKAHRKMMGSKICFLTITKNLVDQYFVSVCTERNIPNLPKTGSAIGLDLGVKRLATTSNGKFKKPFKSKQQKKIRKLQKELERRTKRLKNKKLKKKQSNNRIKTRRKINVAWNRIKNQRSDYLHKYSKHLIENQDLIVMENLKVKNMSKSAKGTVSKPGKNVKQKSGLNRVILNQSWGELRRQIKYKCDWYGKQLLEVDPKHTSRICYKCGHNHKKNRRSQSRFVCRKCGFHINADQNASRNILKRGLETLIKDSTVPTELRKQYKTKLVEISKRSKKQEASAPSGAK